MAYPILKNKCQDKLIPECVSRLTISSHWCTATATCVPSGLVNTNTSPGTALSGLECNKHGIIVMTHSVEGGSETNSSGRER